jgi:hypothetical protein
VERLGGMGRRPHAKRCDARVVRAGRRRVVTRSGARVSARPN